MTQDSASQDYESSLSGSDNNVASFARTHTPIQTIQHVLHGNPTLVPVIVLLVSIAVFGLVAGDRFFSAFNLTLIMQQVSIIGILAAAQTLIILSAGIDLSVAAIMVLMSVIAGNLAVGRDARDAELHAKVSEVQAHVDAYQTMYAAGEGSPL